MGLHAEQLGEYLWLHVNQHVLNMPETYTPSGGSAMTSVAIPSKEMNTLFSPFHCLPLIF